MNFGADLDNGGGVCYNLDVQRHYDRIKGDTKGKAIVKYGKFCAHQGILDLMPSGSMASFGAALALGADEIEFDIRLSKDGKLIVCHDATIDRYAGRSGNVADLTLDELREINFGLTKGWVTSICTAEEVFEMFGGKLDFNVHLKETGEGMVVKEIARLAEKYDCVGNIYMAGCDSEMLYIKKYAPHIRSVYIQFPGNTDIFIDQFIKYGCYGVQFWKKAWTREMADRVHECGGICNLFSADTVEDMEYAFANGVDTVLTNRMDIAAEWKRRQ